MIWALAVFTPPLVAGLSSLARAALQNTHAILLLVFVVASIGATGLRAAGLICAVAAALAYNYFWTEPYGSLQIFSGGDIVTVILLMVVGGVCSQLSWWLARQRVQQTRRQDYLTAIHGVATESSDAPPAGDRLQTVADTIASVLDADRCRYVRDGRKSSTVLGADGLLRRGDQVIDVDRDGLPTDDIIAVPVASGAGHFEVSAATRVARPSLEQRQVAALIGHLAAGQVGRPASR